MAGRLHHHQQQQAPHHHYPPQMRAGYHPGAPRDLQNHPGLPRGMYPQPPMHSVPPPQTLPLSLAMPPLDPINTSRTQPLNEQSSQGMKRSTVICQGGGRTLHTLADFSGPTARVPAPNAFTPIDPNSTCSPRAILFQTYNRDMAALEAIYRWRQQPEIVEVKPEESSEEEKEEMTKYMRSSPTTRNCGGKARRIFRGGEGGDDQIYE